MGFRIDVQAAQGLPAQLDRLREDADRGMAYVTDQTRLSYGGILDTVSGSHEETVGKVRDYLDQVANQVAGGTAATIRAALTYYRRTDAVTAASLDATYPVAEGGSERGDPRDDRPRIGADFQDRSRPTDRYRPRPDHSDEFPYEPSMLGTLASPAAMGRHLIITATALAEKLGLGHRWDPYEAILKPLTGDWNGLRGCKDVFANVAEALSDMGVNAYAAANSITAVWEGNAADGARNHLLEVGRALEEAGEPLDQLGEAYERAAEGSHELFKVLADVLGDIIDGVIEFMAEAEGAAATSETVIGGAVLGGMAAYDAYKVYGYIQHAVEIWAKIQAVVELLRSGQHNFGLVHAEGSLPKLPTTMPALPGQENNVPSMGPTSSIPSIGPVSSIPSMAAAAGGPARPRIQLPL